MCENVKEKRRWRRKEREQCENVQENSTRMRKECESAWQVIPKKTYLEIGEDCAICDK